MPDVWLYKIEITLVPTGEVSGFGIAPLAAVGFAIAAILLGIGFTVLAFKISPKDIGRIAIGVPIAIVAMVLLMVLLPKQAEGK